MPSSEENFPRRYTPPTDWTAPVHGTLDKREIGDAAIPMGIPPQPSSLRSLANERAVSSDVTL